MENAKKKLAGEFLNKLHEKAGLCGHCGKKKCSVRKGWSVLPDRLQTDDVLSAVTSVFGEI